MKNVELFKALPPEDERAWDPSLPKFRFSEQEKEKMLGKGMSVEEIKLEEEKITKAQAKAKVRQELRDNPSGDLRINL